MSEIKITDDSLTVTPLLYELPNGDWVDLNRIVGVRAWESHEANGVACKARVVIELRDAPSIYVKCESTVEARMSRRKLAEIVNAFRSQQFTGIKDLA